MRFQLPAFFRRKPKNILPPTQVVGRTGEGRFAPKMRGVKGIDRTAIAHRIDSVSINDYERIRWYPVIVDGIQMLLAAIGRANFHFACEQQEGADLASHCLKDQIPFLMVKMSKGSFEFGHQVIGKRWEPQFSVTVSKGQQSGGAGEKRFYPFVWNIKRFEIFDQRDTRLLVDTLTSDFGGLKQNRGQDKIEMQPIPARRLIHFAHNRDMDNLHGVPLTKPCVPFVELAESVYDSMGEYCAVFATGWKLGRYPTGRTSKANDPSAPQGTDHRDEMLGLLDSLEAGHSVALPSKKQQGSDAFDWDIEVVTTQAAGDNYVEKLDHLNTIIRMPLTVPDYASSESQDSGTYNLGQAKIDLFLANIETILNLLCTAINDQLLDEFRINNFGFDYPPITLHVQPLDQDTKKALLQALIDYLGSGEPLQTSDGKYIVPDWAAMAQETGLSIQILSSKDMATRLRDEALRRVTGESGSEGTEANVPSDLKLSEKKRMNPVDIQVHPDMQYKTGADSDEGTRDWADDATYDKAKESALLVWLDSEGGCYVVNGHHRRKLAIDSGIDSVPVEIIKEADGVTFEQAKELGRKQNEQRKTLSE